MTHPNPRTSLSSRIFVVEDHPRFRLVLEEFIAGMEGVELCGSSDSAEGALEQIPDIRPDLILIDVALPGMNGIQLVGELRQRDARLRCVMFSGYRSNNFVEQSRRAGAHAYVAKSEVYDLEGILRDVLRGGARFRSYS